MTSYYVGVDTHKHTHVVAVMDGDRNTVSTKGYLASPSGIKAIIDDLPDCESCKAVAIECCGTYGKGLVNALSEEGYCVVEVPSTFRHMLKGASKSDRDDASAAALFAFLNADKAQMVKFDRGYAEELSFLVAARKHAVKEATSCMNAIKGLLVKAPDVVRYAYKDLSSTAMAEAFAKGESDIDSEHQRMVLAIESLALRWSCAKEQQTKLEKCMEEIVVEQYPHLLQVKGVGVLLASEIMAIIGDNPERFKSEAAFAKTAGTAPLEASSGMTNRHRLNRSGNRQLNCAIHRIAIIRLSNDERTKEYMRKRTSEGKTKREIIRCLKRYISRELYSVITKRINHTEEDPKDLRRRRCALGLSQTTVEKQLQVGSGTISRIERGATRGGANMVAYIKLLKELEKST